MGLQLNYSPERGIEPKQTLQLSSEDLSLFTKEGYVGENKEIKIILFVFFLSFCLRKIIT